MLGKVSSQSKLKQSGTEDKKMMGQDTVCSNLPKCTPYNNIKITSRLEKGNLI